MVGKGGKGTSPVSGVLVLLKPPTRVASSMELLGFK